MNKMVYRLMSVIAVFALTLGGVYYNTGVSLSANIYYVSTVGSDANAGIPLAPFKTIQKCANVANAGDTCIVMAGTYNEQIEISKNGITLEANGKVLTKQIYIPSSNNTVRGFTITDKTANNGFQVSGNFNLIENNEIYQTKQDGIWFFGHDNTFRGNYIHDILDPSITGDPHADCFQTWDWNWDTYNVLFDGNTCDHNRTSGSNQIVMLSGSAHDLIFRNNRFIMHDAGYSPLALWGGTDFTIENNYLCNSTGQGSVAVYLSGGTNVTLTNNTYAGYSSLVSGSGVLSQSGTVKSNLPCVVFPNPIIPTPTYTPTKTSTITPSKTPTATATKIWTPTPSFTPTKTPTLTPSVTMTPINTLTPTATPLVSDFEVYILYRGNGKTLNSRDLPTIWSTTNGNLYPGTYWYMDEKIKLENGEIWARLKGQNKYIPMYYNGKCYTRPCG